MPEAKPLSSPSLGHGGPPHPDARLLDTRSIAVKEQPVDVTVCETVHEREGDLRVLQPHPVTRPSRSPVDLP
ncbi:MAG: hypothetical protein VX223_03085, partial [Myxococcota bacterium]|nr:hypothetical protein [Myxococcota bacterium]